MSGLIPALAQRLGWLLGPRTEVPAEPGSDRLLTLIFAVATLSIYLDTRQSYRAPRAEDTWTFLVYFTIPLCAVVGWDIYRARGNPAVPIGIGLAIALGVTVRVVSTEWGQLIGVDPLPLLGAAVLASGLLVVEARRQGLSLARWGLGLGDWRWWLPRCAVALVGMELLVLGAAAAFPEFRSSYPDYAPAREDAWALLWYQAWLGLYMFAWEGFFRGMFLWGLARRGDALFAIFAAAMPFFLLHWHKPEVEMLASFVGSVGAGWFCLRARSFLPLWLLHWAMNLSMEVTCFVWRRVEGG